jgi:hypothetical protein
LAKLNESIRRQIMSDNGMILILCARSSRGRAETPERVVEPETPERVGDTTTSAEIPLGEGTETEGGGETETEGGGESGDSGGGDSGGGDEG